MFAHSSHSLKNFRSKTTKNKTTQAGLDTSSTATASSVRSQSNRQISNTYTFCRFIKTFGWPLLIVMSTFYQVMGAVRCPKIKKHAGLKLKPLDKPVKEPFMPGDALIYLCESAEFKKYIKCADDGNWSELPYCPDPTNDTCPDLSPINNGHSNYTNPPYKVGSVIAYTCDNEGQLPMTTTTSIATTTASTNIATSLNQTLSSEITNQSTNNLHQQRLTSLDLALAQQPIRYNLTGQRLLKCLPNSKWSHDVPKCNPIYPQPPSQMGLFLTSTALILVPMFILIVIARLFMKRRKRKQQHERWKEYFTDYSYRHSKTSISFGNRPTAPTPVASPVPVTDL